MEAARGLVKGGGLLAVVYPATRAREVYTRAREQDFEIIKEEIHTGVRKRNDGIRLLLMKVPTSV